MDFKVQTESPQEASFQRIISMSLTSCVFQQTALSNHGRFKLDLRSFLYNGTSALRKSTFGQRQVRLGSVQAAFVSIVGDLIDIPAQKFGTFRSAWLSCTIYISTDSLRKTAQNM